MKASSMTVCLFAILLLVGCGGWSAAHRDNAMKEFRGSALPSAAATMNCTEDKLAVRLLPDNEAFPDRALVTGCGRTASYVKTRAGWVMESHSAQ